MAYQIIEFKRGLARMFEKYNLASIKGTENAFIGFTNIYPDKDFAVLNNCFVGCALRGEEYPVIYRLNDFAKDIKNLMQYYGIKSIENEVGGNYRLAWDDGNTFVMENVKLDCIDV